MNFTGSRGVFSRASAGHERKSLVKIGEVTPPKRPPILGPLELGEPVRRNLCPISSPEQAPGVIHQAIAAAYAGRGVAHLTLPRDVIGAKANGGVSSVATLKPRPEIVPNAEDVADIARHIDEASSVVVMCGAGCHGTAGELRALSDRLKAPLIHSVKGKDIMAYDDPHWMGGIGMIGTKADYHAIMHCDLLLMLGTDYPYSEFLPRKGSVIQVDERARVLGRRAPTTLGVVGSVAPTLKLLLGKVAAKSDTSFLDRVTEERQKWDEMLDKQSDPARSKDRIHPQAVARTVSDLAKRRRRSAGIQEGHRITGFKLT